MPWIDRLVCDHCDFRTDETGGGYLYTVSDGKEVILSHPAEEKILKRATGLEWIEARENGLLREKRLCLCYGCSATFYLDIDRNMKTCPECHSAEVRTFVGAVEESCPACGEGVLKLKVVGIS